MAKIKLGATIGDARGSAGAIVYSKNQFGAYIRQKVSPVQPRSTRQLAVRALFGGLAKVWASVLSDAQRMGWIALASTNPVKDIFGDSQILTGLQFYMRCNRNLQEIIQVRMDDPPANQEVQQLDSLSLSAQVSGNIFSVAHTPQTLDTGMHLVVFAAPCLNPGRGFFTPFLKELWADPNEMSGSPHNLFTEFHDRFGQLQEGQRIPITAHIVNDVTGAASTPASANTIVLL